MEAVIAVDRKAIPRDMNANYPWTWKATSACLEGWCLGT